MIKVCILCTLSAYRALTLRTIPVHCAVVLFLITTHYLSFHHLILIDISAKEWVGCSPLTERKTGVSSGVFEETVIYLFGGFNEFSINTIERLKTGEKDSRWEVVRLERKDEKIIQGMGVKQIGSNEILLFGGNREVALSDQAFIFDISLLKLKELESLKSPDSFLQFEPKIVGANVYALGFAYNGLHVFNIKTKKWSLIPESDWAKIKTA
eukprot:TRINITY_DN2277_c0_g1_i4.p1 TRINITY_DN2277_c0_g1~~TRINITY_DN2277_c0_g1_i4.p1  ORF type:complete len:211 (-),score=41.54 TRINITY_DN2277_c0_g1_i4:44-676(-)